MAAKIGPPLLSYRSLPKGAVPGVFAEFLERGRVCSDPGQLWSRIFNFRFSPCTTIDLLAPARNPKVVVGVVQRELHMDRSRLRVQPEISEDRRLILSALCSLLYLRFRGATPLAPNRVLTCMSLDLGPGPGGQERWATHLCDTRRNSTMLCKTVKTLYSTILHYAYSYYSILF